MADLTTVKFQNFGSETKPTDCESAAVGILDDPEASKFNPTVQNYQAKQSLKVERNQRWENPSSLCFVLVFLWAVLATIFCLELLVDKIVKGINSSSSGFPFAPAAPLTFSNISAPRFFTGQYYKGAWFAPAPGWEKECTQMPAYMNKQASSVTVGGHCLLICASTNCESSHNQPSKMCTKIHPDSYGLGDLTKPDYYNQIRSFRQCKTQ